MDETRQTRALFGFRVAGVQDFIDSARTTQDFWASSYIISHLTRLACDEVTNLCGTEALIFPAHDTTNKLEGRIARYPNGILAEVPLHLAKSVASRTENAFHEGWRSIMSAVGTSLEASALKSTAAKAIWERQAGRRTFETFWAWTAVDDGEAYIDAYGRLSGTLEARKVLRDFEWSGDGEPYTKCSQCGRLQALQDIADYSEKACKTFWQTLSRNEEGMRHRFRASERLCSVCVTCRLVAWTGAFGNIRATSSQPSTSSIAATPFLKHLAERAAEDVVFRGKVVAFISAIEKIFAILNVRFLAEAPYPRALVKRLTPEIEKIARLDGDWLFADVFEEHRLEKEFGLVVQADLLRSATRELLEICDALEAKPSAYLALVAIDGDDVGEWINGGKTKTPPTMAAHRSLSYSLGRIGQAVQEVIETDLLGRLIYSGGDDILCLLPVNSLVGGIHEVIEIAKSALGEQFTQFNFSAAGLIMPHSDSLSGSIREAEALLREEAKLRSGKDSIAISARRQSGQKTQVSLKSGACSSFQSIVSAMSTDVIKGGLSPRIASQFSDLVAGLAYPGLDPAAIEEMSLFLVRRHILPESRVYADIEVDVTALCDNAARRDEPARYMEQAWLTARFLTRCEQGQ